MTRTKKTQWIMCMLFVAIVSTIQSKFVFSTESIKSVDIETLTLQVRTRLNELFIAAQSTDELFPGATLAIALPDGLVLEFTVGFADTAAQLKMPKNARMPAGSIGKTFVSTVALGLVADGVLELDEPITRWLGDKEWLARLPNYESITLRHLLNHSSGIIDHVFDSESSFQSFAKDQLQPGNPKIPFDPREFVQFVLDKEPLFPAGDGFHYSDTGYILVGMIIEAVTEKPYYEVLTQGILKPQELIQTSPLDSLYIPGVVQGYAPQSNKLFGISEEVIQNGVFAFHPSIEWTGGGLVSTSADLVKWVKALYEHQVIAPVYVSEMLTSIAMPTHPPDDQGHVYGYGLGVSVAKTDNGICYLHGGFFPGYHSFVAYYPNTKIAIAMQINADDSEIETHFNDIATLVFSVLDAV